MKKKNGIIHKITDNVNCIKVHDKHVSEMYTKILSEIFSDKKSMIDRKEKSDNEL